MNGTVLPDWPVSVGARMTANVLITRVSTTHTTPDMVGQLLCNPVIQNLFFAKCTFWYYNDLIQVNFNLFENIPVFKKKIKIEKNV